MNLVFDIETDGLYHDVTQIHCIGVYDLDANQTLVYNDTGMAEPITRGIQLLEDADAIIGHNIIGYDIPVIQRLFPWFAPECLIIDTLVLSRCYHTDILSVDGKRKWKNMPLQLYGRHSLEAYGHRLGEYKGEFGKSSNWKEWSEDMQEYCLQDVRVTKKLWEHFQPYLTGLR